MYTVEVSNTSGNVFEVKARENKFIIEPSSDNLSPGETLLASLGSCVALYTRRYLNNAKIISNGFSLKLEAEFSDDSPVRFKQIKVQLDLRGIQFDPRRKDALLGFIKNCPVGNTLKGNPDIEIDLV